MDPLVVHSFTGLLVPLFGMVFLAAIVGLILEYRQRRLNSLHQTVTQLLERGQPVPPELFSGQKASAKPRLHQSLTLIGAGIGLIIYLSFQPTVLLDFGHWSLGAIPLAIGLAQLLAWKLDTTPTR